MAKTVGGRVDITINGAVYHPTADVKLEETDIEVDEVTNQDGTIGRSVKAKAYTADITFRDMGGLDLRALQAATFDMSLTERDTNRVHLFTAAFLKGKPSRNTTNGEISGLSVVTDTYRRIGT